jgi:hypothetical protein
MTRKGKTPGKKQAHSILQRLEEKSTILGFFDIKVVDIKSTD